MASFVTQLLSMMPGLHVGGPTTTKVQPTTPPPHMPRTTFDMTKLSAEVDMIAISEANALSSPLLRLPSELRANIFYHTLGGYEIRFVLERSDPGTLKRDFEIRRPSSDSKLTSEEMQSFLNLTLVCRQIYAETGLLPFVTNTFVLTHTEDGEKWLAQKIMPAQQRAIATVQCRLRELFFDFEAGPLVSRHCTGTFRQLEGLQCLILDAGGLRLAEEEKDMVVVKVRKASGNAALKVRFLEST